MGIPGKQKWGPCTLGGAGRMVHPPAHREGTAGLGRDVSGRLMLSLGTCVLDLLTPGIDMGGLFLQSRLTGFSQ